MLDDRSALTDLFRDDDYLRRHNTRSALCMPLLKQSRLVAVIYLENSLTSGVFTSARTALLELLASEAAISLENAQLYRELREREHESREIVDSIPAMAWSAHADGTPEFFNRQYLDYVGLSAKDVSAWGWTGTVHPDDIDQFVAAWQRSIASGLPGEAEARVRRGDGEYRWFLQRAKPLRDEAGNIAKWYGINTDIEARKRAETELRRAYDSFTQAQRLSQTGSFITDLHEQHTWSEEAHRILGLERGTKITMQAIRELIHSDDLPSFESAISRAITGVNVDFAFRIVTHANVEKHVRGAAHAMEWIEGRPVMVGALQDVTESKVREEALNRARTELAHVARVGSLSILTASIAHEVSQPLSGIITNVGACLRMLDAEPPNVDGARQTAKRTIRDSNRAAEVINRLRALYSKSELTLEPLDLNEATREVIALSLSELQRNGVVLQSALADELPRVAGDRIQLQQVILNLLRNGADAMLGVHGRPRHLLLRTEAEAGEGVRVTVRDVGAGFDLASKSNLFEAFYTTKPDGMGIGLSICRSIIERHHGRIWAEANEGPGATFLFSLPQLCESV